MLSIVLLSLIWESRFQGFFNQERLVHQSWIWWKNILYRSTKDAQGCSWRRILRLNEMTEIKFWGDEIFKGVTGLRMSRKFADLESKLSILLKSQISSRFWLITIGWDFSKTDNAIVAAQSKGQITITPTNVVVTPRGPHLGHKSNFLKNRSEFPYRGFIILAII